MQVDYNPQLGYRRTIFQGDFDFLTELSSFECRKDGLHLTARTYRGREVPVKASFLSDTAFRFQMFPDPRAKKPGNPVFTPEGMVDADWGETGGMVLVRNRQASAALPESVLGDVGLSGRTTPLQGADL